ncbi:hypothetical protein [Acinetobacter beijerinckii]|uniref:hypothetical protein n=1 Tax=Acinetobacter beijerinckii TaxID=262668 RepID=UPI0024065294|nr:hypothetical protein [Acinetobacter beijerinckii]
MKNRTLFIIQSNYMNTDKILVELAQMAQTEDSIVVMGDALLKLTNPIVDIYSNLYCLSNEQTLLNNEFKPQFKVIEYSEFANLVLEFENCISLK